MVKKIGIVIVILLILFGGIGIGYLWGHEVGWVQSRNFVCGWVHKKHPKVTDDLKEICPMFKFKKETKNM